MERDEHSGGSSPRFGLPFPEQILIFSCLPSRLGIVRAAPGVHSLIFWNDDLRHTVGFLVGCRSQRPWGYSLIFLSIRRTEEALGSKSRQPSSQEKVSTKYGRSSVRHRKEAQLLSYHKDVANCRILSACGSRCFLLSRARVGILVLDTRDCSRRSRGMHRNTCEELEDMDL